MNKKAIEDIVLKAQKGDDKSREWLIQVYRPVVLRIASRICKRQIHWNQDEASISLIAFNDAIDRFDPTFGKSFDSFSQMMIHNRLIDEFRKNSRLYHSESLYYDSADEMEASFYEVASSLMVYTQEQEKNDLASEMVKYDQTLQEYGIYMEELEEISPQHQDTRMDLILIATLFSNEPSMINHLKKTKQLPLKQMVDHFGTSRKRLERNRKYLIALILIFSDDEFSLIRNTIKFTGEGE
jgi:RNA polymerase sigma factor